MIDLGEKSAANFMRKMAKETPMQRNGTGRRLHGPCFSSRPRRSSLPAGSAVDGALACNRAKTVS